MKKTTLMLLVIGLVFAGAMSANAGIWKFQPEPSNLFGLDHHWAYEWGIEWPQYEEVTEVTLTFHDIQDFVVEPDDILYVRLFDDAPLGVTSYWDDQASGDYFEGQGTLVDTWSDPSGAPNPPVTMEMKFSELGLIDAFNEYASDGLFGLGFDPDCHYWNSGVELTVETAIPEPTTMSLMLLGLAMVSRRLYRRKIK